MITWAIIILAILQVLDTGTTEYMIRQAGLEVEVNPLVRYLFSVGGWPLVLSIKLLLVSFLFVVRKHIKYPIDLFLMFALGVYTFIVLRSVFIIASA